MSGICGRCKGCGAVSRTGRIRCAGGNGCGIRKAAGGRGIRCCGGVFVRCGALSVRQSFGISGNILCGEGLFVIRIIGGSGDFDVGRGRTFAGEAFAHLRLGRAYIFGVVLKISDRFGAFAGRCLLGGAFAYFGFGSAHGNGGNFVLRLPGAIRDNLGRCADALRLRYRSALLCGVLRIGANGQSVPAMNAEFRAVAVLRAAIRTVHVYPSFR